MTFVAAQVKVEEKYRIGRPSAMAER